MAFSGEELKRIRKEKKISQKTLAGQINKSVSSIRKYESGDTQPPLSVIEEIAQVLHISVSDLTPHGFNTPLEFEMEWIRRGGGHHPGRNGDIARIEINKEKLNDAGIKLLADHSDLLVNSGQYIKQ